METYLVISEHSAEECNRALQYFHEYHESYLTKFWWGCADHDHNAYAIVEAENHNHARMSVPPLARDKARIIKLLHFNQMVKHPE
jgi:hypothetical protein